MSELHFSPRPNRAHEIAWQPWSAETFARAQHEDKPLLLAISAVWCHWCHVMDETTYSDPAVIAAINERFVPVRVDNDVRPDVNARYNMGGWPTTAFLAPDGTTITGATYLPPDQMTRALDEIAGFYANNKSTVAARSVELRGQRRSYQPAERGELRETMIARVVEEISDIYDAEFGGFGDAPKFPHTDVLELLQLEYCVTGERRLLDMVANTLQHMASGGTYDRVEGGFFRYSTTRDWSVPHFEKMAEDHAGLLRALSQLAMLLPDAWIRDTLRSAAGYVRDVLRDPQTGFFAGSQDADEVYFAKTLEERRAVTPPFVDRRAYANWTASLASSGLFIARALDAPQIAERSLITLDSMHERLRDDDGLLYHVLIPGEPPSVRGLLTDQVAYLRALLDAHEHTGEVRFLERAVALADAVIAHFAADDGGFYDRTNAQESLGNLTVADRPLGDNGLLADALLRVSALSAQPAYAEQAERTLLLYAKTFARAGTFAATYARALRRYLMPETSIRIVGDRQATQAFREAALRDGAPLASIRTIAPADTAAFSLPASPAPAAYVCTGTTCSAPIRDPAGFSSPRG